MSAVSQGGAWGLMQVTWTTAETLVALLRKRRPGGWVPGAMVDAEPEHRLIFEKWTSGKPACLLDPELNVMLGAFYLNRFAAEFGRDLGKCAVAYHNGAGFLRKFLDDPTKRFPNDLPPKGKLYRERALTARMKYADEDPTPAPSSLVS